jgi:hypothetical protein
VAENEAKGIVLLLAFAFASLYALVTVEALSRISRRLDRLSRKLLQRSVKMAASLKDILSKVTDQKTSIDGVIALLKSVQAESDPATRDAILAQVLANTASLDDALKANVPAPANAPAPATA